MIRVLVCGGRDFTDEKRMAQVLQSMFDPDDTVTLIHGAARGADQLSEKVLTGYFHGGFQIERYLPEWDLHGKKAGYLRNKRMLEEGKPDFVIAFPGGKGTANMVRLAEEAGVKVRKIESIPS